MKKSNFSVINKSSNSNIISYYTTIRETIHGLDRLIVTVIHQSVTIITGCLTFSILLYEKIKNSWHAPTLALILIIIAFFLTLNSQRKIKLYTNLMAQNIEVAVILEDLLFKDDKIKITQKIQKIVEHAGVKGEGIFLAGIKVFYAIEFALFVYFIVRAICACF